MPKVLIIDDSVFQRQFMRGQLEEAGFEVEDWLPVSALEIIERIRNSQLDAVISDYNMPHVDGLTVLKMVKRANPELPVIILTAVRNPEREERLVTGGVARILHKPVTASDLAQAVRQVVGPGQQG